MLRSISIVVVAAVVLVIGLVLQLKPFFIHNENVTKWQHATPLCYGSGSMALVMLVVDSLQFQFYSWFLHVNLCVSVYVCIYASIYIVKFPIFLYIIWFWETHCLFQSICCFCVRYFIYFLFFCLNFINLFSSFVCDIFFVLFLVACLCGLYDCDKCWFICCKQNVTTLIVCCYFILLLLLLWSFVFCFCWISYHYFAYEKWEQTVIFYSWLSSYFVDSF